jgi:hypothetical protein
VRRTGGQWGMAVRPPVSAHRPRGTGLDTSRASLAVGAQWRWREARTAGFPDASACALNRGTTGRRGAQGATSRENARSGAHTVSDRTFQNEISPNLQT